MVGSSGGVSREPDFSTRSDASRSRKSWETLLLAVGAALFVASVGGAPDAVRDAREREAAIAALRQEVEGLRGRLRGLEARRRTGGDQLTSQLVLTAEAPPTRVLAEITELLPPDVRLESVGLAYGARLDVEAVAVARSPASYDLFLERLAASPLFSEILPGPEAREAEMRGTLRMAYRRLP